MVTAKARKECGIAFILAFALCGPLAVTLEAVDPPDNLARRVAENESASRDARSNYTYRQEVIVEEVAGRRGRGGVFRETRDIVFSPAGERSEQLVGRPEQNLDRLRMTDEDFHDIREVHPFLFTNDQLWAYQVRYKGEEQVEGIDCWVLEVKPRQILDGQRLFDGLLWVHQQDYSVVRSEGKAVPDIMSSKGENLFPRFTTIRERIDGRHWFPIYTYADDTLAFRGGPLRMKLKVKYSNYKRFAADSTVTFEK